MGPQLIKPTLVHHKFCCHPTNLPSVFLPTSPSLSLTSFRCCVVAVDEDKVDLSLRASRTGEQVKEEADTPPDPEIASLEDLAEGDVVRGYVKAVTNVGVFVR